VLPDGGLPSPFILGGPDPSNANPNAIVISKIFQQSNGGGQPAEFGAAINFVSKIKLRFMHQTETYREFLEILQKYQREQRPYQEVSCVLLPQGMCLVQYTWSSFRPLAFFGHHLIDAGFSITHLFQLGFPTSLSPFQGVA
jgi:hypothetical protein